MAQNFAQLANFDQAELGTLHAIDKRSLVRMANREELSHYILDFAMETTKKVKQKETKLAQKKPSVW